MKDFSRSARLLAWFFFARSRRARPSATTAACASWRASRSPVSSEAIAAPAAMRSPSCTWMRATSAATFERTVACNVGRMDPEIGICRPSASRRNSTMSPGANSNVRAASGAFGASLSATLARSPNTAAPIATAAASARAGLSLLFVMGLGCGTRGQRIHTLHCAAQGRGFPAFPSRLKDFAGRANELPRLPEKAQRLPQRRRIVLADRRGERLLRELFAGGIGDHRHMQVAGRRVAERTLKRDLARRRPQQVGAPHHIRDAVVGVVDHDGELVGMQAIAPLHHEIADVAREVLRKAAADPILEDDRSGLDAKPVGPV